MRYAERFELEVAPDFEAMSRAGADWLVHLLRGRHDALLGLATGASPARVYELLAAKGRVEPSLLAEVRVLKTDEWGGLAMDDPGTSEAYLREHVVKPWLLEESRFTGWQSNPADPQAEAGRMRTWIAENGPLDGCVLGLGVNGHLLMNEPAEALAPSAHVATLAESTLGHGMLQTARHAPRYGLTLGIADLLNARRVLLLVSGANKAEPLRRFFSGRVTPQFPASFLWLHPALTVLCDAPAASLTESLAHRGQQRA